MRPWVTLSVLALLGATRPARADDKAACVNAYVEAQRHRKSGKLVTAAGELATCEATCPAALRADCDQWRADNEARLASVVIVASDAQGHAVSDVSVFVDEELRATSLEGKPLVVDPGEHLLRFERSSSPPVTQRVLLREREKDHAVAIELRTPSVVPPASPSSPLPYSVYVSGGVAAVGLLGLVYFGVRRANEVSALSDCKPDCSPSDVRAANLDLYLAGTSLLVGLAGAGAAAFFASSRPSVASGQAAPGFVLGVTPACGGLHVALKSDF